MFRGLNLSDIAVQHFNWKHRVEVLGQHLPGHTQRGGLQYLDQHRDEIIADLTGDEVG